MACIAVNAVVHVPIRVGVVEVGGVAAAMAGGGAGEHGVVRGVGVTGGANRARIAMVGWEEGVVTGGQVRRHPGGRGVTSDTRYRPSCGDVIGIRGSSEVLCVAGVAIRGRPDKDVVNVAKGASDGCVRAGQRERRVVVIEGCPCPIGGAMACVAGCGEACSRVCWIRSSVVIRHVATGAKGW